MCVSVLTSNIAKFSGSENHTAQKTLKLLLLRLTYTNQKQLPDTGPRRDTGVMSKPIQTLLAAYVDNLVAAESLVEERVPVMEKACYGE